MNITGYDIQESHNGEKYIFKIWAVTQKAPFSLPPVFDGGSIGKIEAEQLVFNLTQWYGLPVDAEKIMSHFIDKMK